MSGADRWDDDFIIEKREEHADRIQELLGLRAYAAHLEAERDQLKLELKLSKRILNQQLSDLGSSHLMVTYQRDALMEALKLFVADTVEYATLNHLGDPETLHRMKAARAAIALTSAAAPGSAPE